MKERPILFSAPMVRAILDGRKTQTRRIMNPQPQWRPNWGTAVGMNGEWIIGSPVALGLQDRGDYWMSVFDEDAQRRFCTKEAYGWGARAGSPYGVAGDYLWVRETHYAFGRWETRYSAQKERDEWHFVDLTLDSGREYQYPDTFEPVATLPRGDVTPSWWKRPAIFMPRAASRIAREIVTVRIEQLNDCSEVDAIAEGVEPYAIYGGKPASWKGAADMTAARETAREAYRDLWDSINGAGAWAANPWVWVVEFGRV